MCKPNGLLACHSSAKPRLLCTRACSASPTNLHASFHQHALHPCTRTSWLSPYKRAPLSTPKSSCSNLALPYCQPASSLLPVHPTCLSPSSSPSWSAWRRTSVPPAPYACSTNRHAITWISPLHRHCCSHTSAHRPNQTCSPSYSHPLLAGVGTRHSR